MDRECSGYKEKSLFERVINGVEPAGNRCSTETTTKNSSIHPLGYTAVRDKYFLFWLHSQAKHDLSDSTVNDNFFYSITHNPKDGRYVYGYIIDGKTEGIIETEELDENRFSICWFYVNKKKHNLGIGQKLFNFVLENFTGCTFELNVRSGNDRAIHIYQKYGFSTVATYETILNDSKVKICTMKREISLLESVGLYFMDDLFCEDYEYLSWGR